MLSDDRIVMPFLFLSSFSPFIMINAYIFGGMTFGLLFLEYTMYPIVGTMVVDKISVFFQRAIIGALMLWVLIVAAGWIQFIAIEDGLNAFIGDDLVYAEKFLNENKLDMTLCRTRILKNKNGSLITEQYTWWGITPTSSSCDEFYQVWWSNWES